MEELRVDGASVWRALAEQDARFVAIALAHPDLVRRYSAEVEALFATHGPPPEELRGTLPAAPPRFAVRGFLAAASFGGWIKKLSSSGIVGRGRAGTRPHGPLGAPDTMVSPLSAEQLSTFAETGFLVLRGAVGMALVDAARREVNASLGRLELARNALGEPELPAAVRSSRPVTALLHESSLATHAQALLGSGQVLPCADAQVALRFPDDPAASVGREDWHIDGFGGGNHSPFDLLVGVALSDATRPGSGNLCVHPGSHVPLSREVLRRSRAGQPLFSVLPGHPSKPALGPSTPVLLGPGDAVLAHQKLAHFVGANASPDVRYQVYFRLSSARRASEDPEAWLADAMMLFEGTRPLGQGNAV